MNACQQLSRIVAPCLPQLLDPPAVGEPGGLLGTAAMFRMKDGRSDPDCVFRCVTIVQVASSVSGLSHLDRTGLLLLSEILAARCQARAGFEVRGLLLQVAPLVLKDFAPPASLTALDSRMHAPASLP